MKKTLILIAGIVVLLVSPSCKRSKHFISDKEYRKKVEIQFNKQEELGKNRKDQLFAVFDRDISLEEKEALQFLFAYMPLSDLADYDGDFFLKNVRSSFAARDTFSWGKTVPEILFRHFVLPVRVNNENLDSSRWVFFSELKDRIRNLPMKDAVLEVNHWCHEKVTYRGTDIRTSSPLATVKTAFGRCGEESTFTVAALRAVGIPARQCYTPRWAHSDDNHAWVEVWVDGKWHYIGACEPEPEPDMAWFTAPAKRAMLVNTNVFGDYDGPEDVLLKDERYTRINILSNYTETKRIFTRVVDTAGKPVDSASVEYQLYNYAEFYPLYRGITGKDGTSSFLTGLGDLLIWASKDGKFGYRKISVKKTDTVTISLIHSGTEEYSESMDLIPPPEIKTDHPVTDSVRKANNERLAFEDRIRTNYENTFIDSSKAWRLAKNLRLSPDTLWHILRLSRGNWRELIDFITGVPEDKKQWIFPLLLQLSEKDLRDGEVGVLDDNILHSPAFSKEINSRDIYEKYILCPRIDDEYLKPYKAFFNEKLDSSFIRKAIKDPGLVSAWIRDNIRIDKNANYSRVLLTPRGSFELGVADPPSRDVLFVALCRSIGIPARLEPATYIPQFYQDNRWHDADFEKKPEEMVERGDLVINNSPGNKRIPEYYIHFTVEKLEKGFFRSLDYEEDPVMKKFPCKVSIPSGSYLVVTGNRISGGTVLAKLDFFTLEPGKQKEIQLDLRKEPVGEKALGKTDLLSVMPFISSPERSQKEYILAWLEPDREPTKHFISELTAKKTEFKGWKGEFVFFFNDKNEKDLFASDRSKDLPENTRLIAGYEPSLGAFNRSLEHPAGKHPPVVALIRGTGDILYLSEGYRIGIPGELLKLLKTR